MPKRWEEEGERRAPVTIAMSSLIIQKRLYVAYIDSTFDSLLPLNIVQAPICGLALSM